MKLPPGKHSLKTSLGNVSLTLPVKAGFQIDASAGLGQISNAFPLAKKEQSNDTRLVGTIGTKSKATVQVHVDQGSIVISKAK